MFVMRISRRWRFRVWLAMRLMGLATMALPKNAAFSARSVNRLADPNQNDQYEGQHLH
jgi:hypothetical protein